jgi:hypothetical protein
MKKTTIASKIKAGALRGVGVAARFAGKALRLLGGPMGLLLLIVPLIIENWDKIVAFFKDFGPKVLGFFSELGKGIGKFFGDLFTSIGNWFTNTLLPFFVSLPGRFVKAVSGFWSWITDLLGGLFTSIGNWFTNTLVPFLLGIPRTYIRLVAGFWGWIFDLLGTLFTNIGNWFTNTRVPFLLGIPRRYITLVAGFWSWIIDLLGKAFTGISDYFAKTVLPFITGIPGRFADGAKNIWGFFTSLLTTAYGNVKSKFDEIVNWVRGLPSRVADAAKNIWNGFRDGFRDALNWIIDRWNAFRIDARFPPDFIVPFLRGKGFTLDTPNIPRLAKGGIIPAVSGGTMAIIGEAGRSERVEPLDPDGLSKRDKAMVDYLSAGGGKGVTVNVYPSAGMDERQLATLVSRQLAYQMRRGAA